MQDNSVFPETPPAPKSGGMSKEVMIIVGILIALCCLVVVGGAAAYFLYQQSQVTAAANAESTRVAEDEARKTAEGLATLTAIAESQSATATAQAKIDSAAFADTFDNNYNEWRADDEENEFWRGTTSIENGIYTWDATEVLQKFIAWGSYQNNDPVVYQDFVSSVNVRLESGDPENFCYGLMFREDENGMKDGAYVFTVCDDQYFVLNFFSDATDWQELVEWQTSSAVVAGEWNNLRVEAIGPEIKLYINDTLVAEVTDSQKKSGYISVLINVYEPGSGTVSFDDFIISNP